MASKTAAELRELYNVPDVSRFQSDIDILDILLEEKSRDGYKEIYIDYISSEHFNVIYYYYTKLGFKVAIDTERNESWIKINWELES